MSPGSKVSLGGCRVVISSVTLGNGSFAGLHAKIETEALNHSSEISARVVPLTVPGRHQTIVILHFLSVGTATGPILPPPWPWQDSPGLPLPPYARTPPPQPRLPQPRRGGLK